MESDRCFDNYVCVYFYSWSGSCFKVLLSQRWQAAVQGSLLAAIINGVYAFIPAILGIITLAIVNVNLVPPDAILARSSLCSACFGNIINASCYRRVFV